MPTTSGPFDERTEVPVAGVNGWRCWYRVFPDHGRPQMPGQTDPAAARESINATRVHPSLTDLRYQSALQRYISALSPARGTEEQATHSTWLWNADNLLVRDMMTTNVVTASPEHTVQDGVSCSGRTASARCLWLTRPTRLWALSPSQTCSPRS